MSHGKLRTPDNSTPFFTGQNNLSRYTDFINWQYSEILRNKVVLQTIAKPKTAATTEKKELILKKGSTHS